MSLGNIRALLSEQPITSSAPCRIDFGGTLDISSFHYPLRRLTPATVNIALDLRTGVTLLPNSDERIRVSSDGFADAAFAPSSAPYDHPLGLMVAVADYFGAAGVHIRIQSSSPPKSGLGGSSVAAVALINAFSKVLVRMDHAELAKAHMVLLAHAIEQGVAGVPCGMQDQLAAAFGGVNLWTWPAVPGEPPYSMHPLLADAMLARLDRRLLVAYLGVTHVSRDVNSTWVRQFIRGTHRLEWHEIVQLTHAFAEAVDRLDMSAAVAAMNRETAIRKAMTPGVLDELGDALVAQAVKTGCGARFTGAGGGGCLWAIGEPDKVAALRPQWNKRLAQRPSAGILDCRVDANGVG